MGKIIAVHSFRGGTGKSNTTANVSALLARQGMRVGVVDTDIQSPGIHVLFGLDEDDIKTSLNDYLWGRCEIEQVAQDVTARVDPSMKGKIELIPSSMKPSEIARVLREHYDVGLLNDGFQKLLTALNLDVLMIDTHPGLNEETLLSIAISDALAIIMRPDQQDYQGTSVTVDVARKLDVPKLMIVVNKAPQTMVGGLKERVEQIYKTPVAGVLPHYDEMMILASSGIFSVKFPDHPLSAVYKEIAGALLD